MPSLLRKSQIRMLIFAQSLAMFSFFLFFAFDRWAVSAAGFILYLLFAYLLLKRDRWYRKEVEEYISVLSYRLKKVGEEALLEMPIGILLINDDYDIEWANPYMASCFKEESLVGRSLYDVADDLIPLLKKEEETGTVDLSGRKYKVIYKKEERLLYFFDITEQAALEQMYQEEKPVIGIIFLDNYDEVTQAMDDQERGSLNNRIASLLNEWAQDQGVFLKRVSSDRYVAFLNEKILANLEENKFSILDFVRESTSKNKTPITLSIGIGSGVSSLPELGVLAQSSLDLALGRGGDQAAIKLPNGRVKFYGGKTNPMEKRTRVRARVISHALRELILESSRIFIMGHKYPDMDAMGASIGLLNIARMNNKEAYVILDEQKIDSGVRKLLADIKQHPELGPRLISPERALDVIEQKSLLIVVDTHKPSLVIEEKLAHRIDRIVVIDHHRRSEEFFKNPLLVYMEPYASSTSELVTEILEYQPNPKIEMLEATALLAGIIVDTKSFTLRTGSRTFDAASFLRSKGADTILVQKYFKEDVESYLKRARLIEKAKFYPRGIAVAKGDPSVRYSQVLIAQTADTLLMMEDVDASFVISERSDQTVAISARSLGKINVQLIMEQLDGGGHLTNAATQLHDVSVDEAERMLLKAIDDYFEGGKQE